MFVGRALGFGVGLLLLSTGLASLAAEPPIHPEIWPVASSVVPPDPAAERRIDDLLARMSIEEKVGQVIQPEMKSVTPDDVRTYHIGSVENGGGSVPDGNKHASPADWLEKIDAYWRASVDREDGHVRIPMMWATDAVHGHNNVYGATLFPHNIGLGAARDPDLIRRIGEATAREVRALGMDWSFAPTLAVARDDRWGRTYESYAEAPDLVALYADAMVRGLQGEGETFLDQDHVVATAKHYLGDGGTDGGRDQGDNLASEERLRDVAGAGYPPAVSAGVQSVMASFSSWQGTKLHASEGLLTHVLKGRFGFDGILFGDWNAHGQIPGCTNGDCPIAFNAGLDMFNVPEDWKELHGNLVAQVQDGTIPMERLDDAVRRILRVKFRAGIFEQGLPSKRPHAGDEDILGALAHRAIAREAVRKSLVLLKNDAGLLPIDPTRRLLVAGAGADDIGKASGGWTLSWQGDDNTNADFPGATSIWAGLRDKVEAAGGTAILSPDGRFENKPDAAIVVFGEDPYAEYQGDRADLALRTENEESLRMLLELREEGVPTAAVLISGRPLYVNPHINAADAFVAAWLPGSEGAGIADVLLAKPGGAADFDFTGKLSFSWPRRPDQGPLNVGDDGYDPQFAYGYGLRYGDDMMVGTLEETKSATEAAPPGVFLADGRGANGFALSIGDEQAPKIAAVGKRVATYGSESLTLRSIDRDRQEDAWLARWSGTGAAWVELLTDRPVDLSGDSEASLVIELRADQKPSGSVLLGLGGTELATIDVTDMLAAVPSDWTTLRVPLRCFETAGADLSAVTAAMRLHAEGPMTLALSDVALMKGAAGDACPSRSGQETP
ncbi:glycoside hydrolase family 3 protein [Parvularcula dongshanensis]|uniref:Beta-glucosidase n=1 Tax=Parvularcula dongshanensis TaxID=1173995 RepID=A0A840HZU3_9PROT|nr:glycoside hydrolase family 3 protein [Parvularcula dongshanensis]MBB4657543.1 beta-glucosidase [Parvularcula dongshanensis]